MKYSDIEIGEKYEVYKGMEWGFVTVVGKSPPQTIIVQEDRGVRHFVNSANIKKPNPPHLKGE